MAGLHLPNPKMMDVAVPANIHQGLHQEEVARRGWAFSAEEAKGLIGRPEVTLIDLREKDERERKGAIPGRASCALCRTHGQYRRGRADPRAGAVRQDDLFYCAFGERSAMAVQAAQDKGLTSARHIEGGMAAWAKAGGAAR